MNRAQDCCICFGRLSGQSPVGLPCRCRCRSLCCCGGWCVGVAVVVVVVGVVRHEMFVFWSFDLGFWILGHWIFGSRILEFEAGQILDWMRTARFHEEARGASMLHGNRQKIPEFSTVPKKTTLQVLFGIASIWNLESKKHRPECSSLNQPSIAPQQMREYFWGFGLRIVLCTQALRDFS